MLNLYDILNDVIEEGVYSRKVREVLDGTIDGIDKNGKPLNFDKDGNPFYHYVRITYDDTINNSYSDSLPTPKGDRLGVRIIQPYVLGSYVSYIKKTKKRTIKKVLLASHISPQTRRGGPRWDLFRLDRITSWEPIKNKTFSTPAEGYNDMGDNTMTSIDVQVHFNNYGGNNNEYTQAVNRPGAIRQKTKDLLNTPKVTRGNIGQTNVLQQKKRVAGRTYKNSKVDNMIAKNIEQTKNVNRFDDSIWAKAEKEKELQDNKPGFIKHNNKSLGDNDHEDDETGF